MKKNLVLFYSLNWGSKNKVTKNKGRKKKTFWSKKETKFNLSKQESKEFTQLKTKFEEKKNWKHFKILFLDLYFFSTF